MTYALWGIAAVAGAYQLLALAACVRHLMKRSSRSFEAPVAVSILKPVRGLDEHFRDAIRSHANQRYGEFEILFGVEDPHDSAVPEIRRLIAEYPAAPIRLIIGAEPAANGKVGVLMRLAAHARHPVWIVNDSDISVEPDYVERVTAPLADAGIGLVTCLYRARASTWQGRWEALGIATDFAPSTLVAPFVGISEFGLGSTLAFRRADLDRAGGFAAISDYIADDYQVGCRLHSLGLRNVISAVVVETHLGGATWNDIWKHQLRWARTIRVSRGVGYAGLPVTHASLWALVAAMAGHYEIAAALLAVRLAMALTAGWGVLRSADVLRYWFFIPLRDLWGTAVWASGLFGRTVQWRDKTLRLDREGRITAVR